MNLTALDPDILLPGFLAGLIVLATHVPMGREVLKRGIIFIDLAIAQVAGIGVIAAGAAGWIRTVSAPRWRPSAAALIAGCFLTWTERHFEPVQEAIIGCLFILAATAGLILLANDPHGGEALRDLLVGQILWVGYAQLAAGAGDRHRSVADLGAGPAAPWARRVLCVVRVQRHHVGAAGGDLSGVREPDPAGVGDPTCAFRPGPGRGLRRWCGRLCAGSALSALFDLPSGAVVVWALAGVALLISLLEPAFGLRRAWFKMRRQTRR